MITIEQLRKEIKKTDASIIKQLAKRQELVKQIGSLKLQQGKEVVDLNQEKKLFEFYEQLSQQYNLQQPFIQHLFKLIIAYSRQVQQL